MTTEALRETTLREAFEQWLSDHMHVRFWNTTDAVFAAWQAALAHPPEGAQPEPAEAEKWLLELMGEWDFAIPTGAFNEIAAALAAGAQTLPAAPLPHPGSPEASAMLDSLLAEYEYPTNTKNAARAGWEAARRWLATPGVPSDLGAESQGDLTERSGEGVQAPLQSPSVADTEEFWRLYSKPQWGTGED